MQLRNFFSISLNALYCLLSTLFVLYCIGSIIFAGLNSYFDTSFNSTTIYAIVVAASILCLFPMFFFCLASCFLYQFVHQVYIAPIQNFETESILEEMAKAPVSLTIIGSAYHDVELQNNKLRREKIYKECIHFETDTLPTPITEFYDAESFVNLKPIEFLNMEKDYFFVDKTSQGVFETELNNFKTRLERIDTKSKVKVKWNFEHFKPLIILKKAHLPVPSWYFIVNRIIMLLGCGMCTAALRNQYECERDIKINKKIRIRAVRGEVLYHKPQKRRTQAPVLHTETENMNQSMISSKEQDHHQTMMEDEEEQGQPHRPPTPPNYTVDHNELIFSPMESDEWHRNPSSNEVRISFTNGGYFHDPSEDGEHFV